jgi:hypothetical protein
VFSSKEGRQVRCVGFGDYPASLTTDRVYRRVEDVMAERHGLIRVIDDSGEDYLYPASFFMAAPGSKEGP